MGKKLNLINQKYGYLTVIGEADKRIRGLVTWHCKCDCGNEIDVTTNALRSGNTQSCGCLHKKQLIERNTSKSTVKINNKYGKLLVIEDLGLRPQKSRQKNERWSLCKCDCGNFIEVSNNMLQSGWKQSCGCLNSKGELKIENILQQYNLNYVKQYSFNELRGINNGLLRFDFGVIIDNQLKYLIEFDGRQHIQGYDTEYWKHYSNEEITEYDNRKNRWCKEHQIPLIRIPYTHLAELKIEDLRLETSKYILK